MSRRTALSLSRARGRLWAALREDGRVVAIDLDDDRAVVGRVVRGRVRRVLTEQDAAFVDLDAGGVGWLEGATDLRPGGSVRVQVRRAVRQGKSVELTTRIRLVGRYLVLDATRAIRAVSRRVRSAEDRARLAAIVERLDAAPGGGWIARSAAAAVVEGAVRAEGARLLARWRTIEALSAEAGPPVVLDAEPDLLERALRDAPPADEMQEILVDDIDLRSSVLDRLATAPDLGGLLRLVNGAGRIYEETIHPALVEALSPRVALPSGGALTIEETTALVSVDVDSGSGAAKRANDEAAVEIPRQLRLRDLGGAIVIDWVSVRDRRAIEKAVEALSGALTRDPARTRIVSLSDIGLLEMTRERLGPGLGERLGGTGPADQL